MLQWLPLFGSQPRSVSFHPSEVLVTVRLSAVKREILEPSMPEENAHPTNAILVFVICLTKKNLLSKIAVRDNLCINVQPQGRGEGAV